MKQVLVVNLSDPVFQQDPYPTYAMLRAEAPVCRVRLPDGREAWLVTRYDDVAAVLQDHERFSNRAMITQTTRLPDLSPGARDVMTLFELIMSSADPPDHTRLRRLVEQAFAPRLIEGQRAYIATTAESLLDAVEARAIQRGERTLDLIADYAFPLPAAVILHLLGVPGEDRDDIGRWSQPLLKFDRSPESAEALAPDVSRFIAYVRTLLDRKRRHPDDDLLSALGGERQHALTEMELVSLTFQLIFAGHSTTAHLIGNGVLALLTHPRQLARLRDDPTLIRTAIDELLRYDAPQQIRARLALADATIGGVPVRSGDVVLVALGSGNRDVARFAAPDDLDLGRSATRHLAFGLGIHRCFGVPLARLEGEIAIATLVRRMPNLRLAVPADEVPHTPNGLHQRGPTALPLLF